MNPPADDIDLKPEKLEEEKEGRALFHCDLYDADVVHKIAQEFLPGLASACVDNTTGGLFSSPASVAVDMRRDMVDYLVQRSENFVAESVVLEAGPNEEVSDDPYDIISDFIDDFASSKRNFFSRVSGWLLSDKREDKIDDFVQEMEINGFWLLNRRESVAQTLLKNVDFKNLYHCSMKFKSPGDLADHKAACSFRTMTCTNEGCNARFSTAQMNQHDSVCPFKILNCEQNCSDSIMRREMDRHCITVCPMKLVKCRFYSVGCHSSIPQCTVDQHRSENLSSHLLYILQVVHKDASAEALKERIEELVKLSSSGHLAAFRDARSLTYAIKDLEAKLGPLKVDTTTKNDDEISNSTDKKENTDLPTKEVGVEESPRAKRDGIDSPSNISDCEDPCQEKKLVEPPTHVSVQLEAQSNDKNSVASISVQENLKESPIEKENDLAAPNKADVLIEKSSEKKEAEPIKDEDFASPIKDEAPMEKSEEKVAEPVSDEHFTSSPMKGEVAMEKPSEEKLVEPVNNERYTSPIKADVGMEEEKVFEPVEHFTPPRKEEEEVHEHSSVTKSEPNQDSVASISFQENMEESPFEKENELGAPGKAKVEMERPFEEKVAEPVKEHFTSPSQVLGDANSVGNREKHVDSAAENEEESANLPPVDEASK